LALYFTILQFYSVFDQINAPLVKVISICNIVIIKLTIKSIIPCRLTKYTSSILYLKVDVAEIA